MAMDRYLPEVANAILASMTDGLIVIDPGGTVLDMNPSALRLLEYSSVNEARHHHRDFHETFALSTPDGAPIVGDDRPIPRALAGESFSGWELQVRILATGKRLWLRFGGTLVLGDDGRAVVAVVTFHDVTDRVNAERALNESRQRFQSLFDHNVDAIYALGLDGKFLLANAACEAISGYTIAELTGSSYIPLINPVHLQTTKYHFERAARGEPQKYETAIYHKNGSLIDLNVANVPIIVDDVVVGVYGIAKDITVRKRMEHELWEQREHLRLALESGKLGSWQVELADGAALTISSVGKAILGYSPDAVIRSEDILSAIHEDDRDAVVKIVETAIAEHEPNSLDFRVTRPDRTMRWLYAHGMAIYNDSGRPVRLIGVVQDITDRKEREAAQKRALQEAQDQADRDPLTGLLNHRAFHKRLDEESSRALREKGRLAVVLLDLDNFRFFNDVYGHATGDEVLRMVAERLVSICRPYDVISRFGGDEYAIVLCAIGATEEVELEKRLRTALSDITFPTVGQEIGIPIVVSMGIAVMPEDTADRHDALRIAAERLQLEQTGGSAQTEAEEVHAWALANVVGFSMLDSMVTVVANKDRYTRRHSEDVLKYSLIIARQLGIDDKMCHTIAVAAILHDIGKIGVPDAILRKPGPLTEDEFEAVKQHPQMGAVIVAAVPGLEETLDAVRHHHERWDGNGYPMGLTGEETPLIARLMAVADAYSAMTSDRPYRKGMAHSTALGILRQGAGTQWDSECVDALIAGFEAAETRNS